MKGSIEWGTAWCCANFKHRFCYIALLNVRQHGTSTIKLKQIPIRNVVSGWHEIAWTQRPRWDCWRLTGQDLNSCCWKNSSGRKFCKSLAITTCDLNLKHRPCTVKSFLIYCWLWTVCKYRSEMVSQIQLKLYSKSKTWSSGPRFFNRYRRSPRSALRAFPCRRVQSSEPLFVRLRAEHPCSSPTEPQSGWEQLHNASI